MHRITTRIAVVITTGVMLAGCGSSGKPSHATTPATSSKARRAQLLSGLGTNATTADAAGCTVRAPKLIAASHAEQPNPTDWSSNPPTSGKHNPSWASWGRYTTPVEDRYVLHNLEHGGVALWTGSGVDAELTSRIDADLLVRKRKWIVVPRAGLDGFAAASWGTLLTCPAAAIRTMGIDDTISLLGAWYDITNSKQTINEARIPAYAGTYTGKRPVKDISIPLPKQ